MTRTPPVKMTHNLPAPVTSFVGRRHELSGVKALLRQHRLVTLCGAAGSGKTRLAMEVAGGALDRYPDGVWLVDFAAVAC